MDFTELFLGEYEQIQVLRDEARGVLAFVAIHDTRMGPAFGGIRRFAYRHPAEALGDALRLAEAMTWKCVLAGVPGGGGKTVLVWRPEVDREAAYKLIGQFVEQMGGRYFTGPDVGTEDRDLDVVASETGFVAKPDRTGSLAEPTALGTFAGIEAVVERLDIDGLGSAHVLVQGLGEVGSRVAGKLAEAGARLTVTDVDRAACERVAARYPVEIVEPGELLKVRADVFAPCAMGGVVHDLSLEHLQVKAIAGSANNVLAAPEHGRTLFERGVLYAPDFVINAGALIHGALFHLEGQAPPAERILQIGGRVGEIIDRSRQSGRPPEDVALELAHERLGNSEGGRFLPERKS